MSRLIELDQRHIWHPFTQHAKECDPLVIKSARKASLFDEEGHEILDLISSWWTCLHGHAHPSLNRALSEQADKMSHVMFSGFTHPPAITLAERLSALLPGDLNRVFFSDNGSTAVEVALKLAYQYWVNQGESGRSGFIAFERAYHGDTFGAMSVGRGSGFFRLFEGLMCEVQTTPFAPVWEGQDDKEVSCAQALDTLKKLLETQRGKIAAIIIEPMLQAAGGMRISSPDFISQIAKLARKENVLLIFDEVATGFGRTGTLFACQHASVTPDLICLSKGLTGGTMPLSLTVTSDKLFSAFLDESFEKAFAHGHSYTANPLASAVALASLDLFESEKTLEKVSHISTRHQELLERLLSHDMVKRSRLLGTIIACDLEGGEGAYKSDASLFLRDWYLAHGLNIRPIGNTLYLMPPFCIRNHELDRAYQGLLDGLEALRERL